MLKKTIILLILANSIVLMFFGLKNRLNQQSYAYTIPENIKSSITIDASIGEFRFTLFGYTSPKSLVTFEGMGIYDQTYSNDTGYFEFKNRFSPLNPKEACLISQDQLGRVTSPTCIPPFPTQYDVNIGPVLMSPTLSLNQENYYIGDEIIASGQTIPNTKISFSTFIDETKSLWNIVSWGLVKPVNAYTFPQLTAVADEKGNYSISLPSSDNSFFRIFTQSEYNSANTPKSNKLNIKIYPVWMIIIHLFIGIFSLLKSRLLELIIICELLMVFAFLMRRYFHPHIIAGNRALALRDNFPLATEQVSIVPLNNYPITISDRAIILSD